MVCVYPNLAEARRLNLYLLRSRQVELEKRLQHRIGRGREFESLREYRDGDEMRDVCWTATARRAKLVTKVYRPERSQPVWLVLDAGRLMRARAGEFTKLDHAVAAALGLAQVAMAVGLLAYGRKVQAQLQPARGSGQLRSILDRLAVVHGEPVEADHAHAADLLLSLRRRSLVIWLTDLAETAATPEVIERADCCRVTSCSSSPWDSPTWKIWRCRYYPHASCCGRHGTRAGESSAAAPTA